MFSPQNSGQDLESALSYALQEIAVLKDEVNSMKAHTSPAPSAGPSPSPSRMSSLSSHSTPDAWSHFQSPNPSPSSGMLFVLGRICIGYTHIFLNSHVFVICWEIADRRNPIFESPSYASSDKVRRAYDILSQYQAEREQKYSPVCAPLFRH